MFHNFWSYSKIKWSLHCFGSTEAETEYSQFQLIRLCSATLLITFCISQLGNWQRHRETISVLLQFAKKKKSPDLVTVQYMWFYYLICFTSNWLIDDLASRMATIARCKSSVLGQSAPRRSEMVHLWNGPIEEIPLTSPSVSVLWQ